jgi:ribosomal protein S27AE
MTCPVCASKMNHHADKLDYTAELSGEEPIDAALGGVLKEVHTCPKCAAVEMQRAKE